MINPDEKSPQDKAFEDDINATRLNPSFNFKTESEREPTKIAEQLLLEVDEFLAQEIPVSPEEMRRQVKKVREAIYINNSEEAQRMLAYLTRRFGADVEGVTRVEPPKEEEETQKESIQRILDEIQLDAKQDAERKNYLNDELRFPHLLEGNIKRSPEERVAADEAKRGVDIAILAIEKYLETHEELSSKEKGEILSQLDLAIATNNDSRAVKLRVALMNVWKIYGN